MVIPNSKSYFRRVLFFSFFLSLRAPLYGILLKFYGRAWHVNGTVCGVILLLDCGHGLQVVCFCQSNYWKTSRKTGAAKSIDCDQRRANIAGLSPQADGREGVPRAGGRTGPQSLSNRPFRTRRGSLWKLALKKKKTVGTRTCIMFVIRTLCECVWNKKKKTDWPYNKVYVQRRLATGVTDVWNRRRVRAVINPREIRKILKNFFFLFKEFTYNLWSVVN